MLKYGTSIDPGILASQEAELASDMDVSSMPGFAIADQLGLLPTGLRGKTVLDVGSGCSDFVHWLCEQGAIAYGIDPGYEDIERHICKAVAFNQDPDSGPTLLDRIMAPPDMKEHIEAFTNSPLRIFQADFTENPDRYVTGSVLALPYDNDTFDKVVSHVFITSGAGNSREFTIAGMFEMLRVLKRGNELHLGPLLKPNPNTDYYDLTQEIEDNILEAFDLAKQAKVATKLARLVIDSKASRLVITKKR